MFFVYLLKSKLYNQLYIGSTNDLKRRLKEHNGGKHFSTKRYRPWNIVYFEAYISETLARMREKRLKHHGNAIRELKKRTGLLTPKSGAGYTLIELLIAFSIIGLVSILVAAVYFAHSRLFSTQNTSIDVASQNRLALDEMTNQIRESQQVATSCCSPTETTSDQVLVLGLWPLNVSGEPQDPTNGFDYIVYKRDPTDNTKLLKKIVPAAGSTRSQVSKIIATSLATEASGLNFTYDNANPSLASELTINLTTSANSGGKTITSTQTTKAVLRNK